MSYPYPTVPYDAYVLARDGHDLMTGSEQACWDYIHRHHSFSVWWALRHEGYSMRPA